MKNLSRLRLRAGFLPIRPHKGSIGRLLWQNEAMPKAIIAGTVLVLSFLIGAANAQGEWKYKWEAGFQVTTIQLGAPAEKPIGLGGRIGRSLDNHITVEAEANHFPENPSRNFGETQVVGGIKAGGQFSSWGGFIKIRPGLLHFGGGNFRARNSALDHAVLDIGAVAERSITERMVFRMDFGDTIIFYGGDLVNTALRTFRPGTESNLQISFSLGFKF
jgi:hypothetical protein